jgi:hypothetical protein
MRFRCFAEDRKSFAYVASYGLEEVLTAKSPISASALDSSSRPISSKWPASERMVLSSDWQEERKEEDFEDLDPVRSGGEPGIGVVVEPASSLKVIASSQEDDAEVRALCKVAILAAARTIEAFDLEGDWRSPGGNG